MNKFKSYAKKYFIDAMSAMALGLFASLLIGTIFGTVGTYLGPDYINNSLINTIGGFFTEMKGFAQGASGMTIGVAIAYSLKADPLVIFSCAAVGSISYSTGAEILLSAEEIYRGTCGSICCSNRCLRTWYAGVEKNKSRHSCYADSNHYDRIFCGKACLSGYCICYVLSWRFYKYRHRASSFSDGNYYFRCSRNDIDSSNFICSNLRYDRYKRNCRRSRNCGLLRANDRICRNKLLR